MKNTVSLSKKVHQEAVAWITDQKQPAEIDEEAMLKDFIVISVADTQYTCDIHYILCYHDT